ncbi:MAG: Phosphatidylinositol 3-kinase catalytic subunit type 3 [Marteilia pararefringens]
MGKNNENDYSFIDKPKIFFISQNLRSIQTHNILRNLDGHFLDKFMLDHLKKKLNRFVSESQNGFIEIEFPYFKIDGIIKEFYFKPQENCLDYETEKGQESLNPMYFYDPLMDRESSSAIVAHRLSRNSMADSIEPSVSEIRTLELLEQKLFMKYIPTESDLDIIWECRKYLSKKPGFLRLLLQSINHITLNNDEYRIIETWKYCDRTSDLILILEFINLPCVEEYIINNLRVISNEEVFFKYILALYDYRICPFGSHS